MKHLLLALLALPVSIAPLAAQRAWLVDSNLDQLFSVNIANGAATLIGSTAAPLLGTPCGLAWRADTQQLWTLDLGTGSLGTLDVTTAAYTPVYTAVPAAGWQGVEYDPVTRQFYLLNQDTNLYSLDPNTGATTLRGATGAPLMTALDTDTHGTMWGIGFSNGILYQVNKSTGAATAVVTTSPVNMQGLSFANNGVLYGTNTTTDSLYTIDESTGTTTLVGVHGAGVQFAKGLEIETFVAAERAWLIDSNLDELFSINLTNGAATPIGSTLSALLGLPCGLAWRADTRQLWTLDLVSGSLGTLDVNTAAYTPVYTANPASGWQGIEYDLATRLFYLLNQNNNMYSLDPITGVTTLLGSTGAPLMTALDTDPLGTLWGIGFTNGVLYRVNKSTGACTPVVTTSPVNMQGLSFDTTGTLYATNTTTQSLYRIDPTTGSTTLIGPQGAGVQFGKGFEVETFFSSVPAQVVRSGFGCILHAVSYYEFFGPGQFDLANTGLQMFPTGTGYLVVANPNLFVGPTGPGLGLTDDSLSPALALPFSFPYPGGSTTQIRVCSNGFIYLNGTGGSTSFVPDTNSALNGGPRLFPLWMDLLPDGSTNVRNVYFQVDAPNSRVLITWFAVPEFGLPSNTVTMQVALYSSGIVDYTWLGAGNLSAAHNSLVGFSPGAANVDPGSRDISATMPFTTLPDLAPLGQNAQPPIIGTTINLTVTDIRAGSVAGFELLGLPLPLPGLDLGVIGAPGCSLYLSILATLPFGTGGTTATIPIAVPFNTSLLGGALGVQAVTVTPGLNPLGVATSNQIQLIFGTF